MAASSRFRVAISGGGIGGLALAAFICYHSNDIAVDIYETKNEISSIGAGIAIWKRTWQTLQDIGLEDEVIKRNLPLPKEGEAIGPIFRKADQLTAGIDFHNHMMPYGPLAIPRPILLDMLKSRLSSLCAIYTSTHVTSYEEASEGGILIKMKDGSTQTADILIGCDGVHSAIRATLFKNLAKVDTSQGYEKFCEPKWSGSIAYRGVADRNKLRQKNPKNPALDQPRIHVVTHPFGDIVNLVCFYNEENGFGKLYTDPWVDNVPVDQVVGHYEDWEPALVEVVSMIQAPTRWAIHVVEPLPVSVSGRVGLLGDAAHAMTPHQGVGGGQAIEDAHILGRLLAHNKTSRANLSKVLEIYQEVRLPLAKTAAERSRSNGNRFLASSTFCNILIVTLLPGLLYDFIHPDFPLSSTATVEDLMPIGQAVGETFAWLGKGGCDDDWKSAEALISII
ncbi:hypothetical protein H2248_009102 [Termitomyces sp. 'cryptogamus']|nr:hypothetical protein H2248_009102 [Termitomyces sp. 'cryptogamus']